MTHVDCGAAALRSGVIATVKTLRGSLCFLLHGQETEAQRGGAETDNTISIKTAVLASDSCPKCRGGQRGQQSRLQRGGE